VWISFKSAQKVDLVTNDKSEKDGLSSHVYPEVSMDILSSLHVDLFLCQ
jgi:hypothetical protein